MKSILERKLKFKNFIFDFGKVIVQFDTEYLTSIYIKDPKSIKMVEAVVFDRLYWDKLDAGTITDDDIKFEICKRLPDRFHREAQLIYDHWYENLVFIDGMPKLISDIKANGGKLYLISNISCTFAEKYASVPHLKKVLDMFDGLVFSAPLGITKPNPEIFQYLIHKYDIDVNDSVFIDDSERNIVAAESINLCSYLFNGNSKELIDYLYAKY